MSHDYPRDAGLALTGKSMGIPSADYHNLSGYYDESFYDSQVTGSLESARIFLSYLYRFYKPKSVLDVGCGRGAWLTACCELGSEVVVGFDGSWNSQSQMIDDRIRFTAVDLDLPFRSNRKFDLVMTLEVAEHLKPESAISFVQSLLLLSDVILFSAAIPGQGGTNHINERKQSYWGDMFSSLGFEIFDIFRPGFWHDSRVEPWYRQNTFLYVRKGHVLCTTLRTSGFREMASTSFMDCVHPWLWEAKLNQTKADRFARMGFKQHLKDLTPSLVRGIKSRLPI